MSNKTSVGENQLQRIIRDLHEAVTELSKEHRETGEPITDDSPNLHKLSYKLEYLLQFDQKEKANFLGSRKEYWDYFRECLAKTRGVNDGLRFVKAIPELKTSLGKGRAFLRYSLVHQRLADTLQQCLLNHKVTSEWYFARSPFLKSHLSSDIISHLYVLNEVQFDVASRGHDLDADWPTFARRTLGSNSAHLWKPPSRCSSVSSLVSYSGLQEFKAQDYGSSLLADLGEELGQLGEELLGVPTPCTAADDLRIQVDHSELRHQELLHQSEARQAKLLQRVRELDQEAEGLRDEVRELQGKLLAQNQESVTADLNNMDLLSKLDSQEKARLEEERDAALQQTQVLQEGEEREVQEEARLEEERDAALQQTQVLQEGEEREVQEEARLEEERDAALQQTQVLQEEERDAALQQTQVLQEGEEREVQEGEERNGEVQDEKEGEERREVQEERERKENREEQERKGEVPEREEKRKGEKREVQEWKVMEKQLQELREELRSRDRELTESREKIRQLEEENTDRLTGAGQEREKGEMDGEKEKLGTEKETAECSHSNLHKAGSAEGLSMEKNQHLSPCPQTQHLSPCPQTQHLSPCPQTQQLLSPAVLVAQLQLNQGEVLRLQTEVEELRARLQIRSQAEGLNRQHVEELLLAQEREEALGQEQRHKAQASQGLVLELASAREELHSLKRRYEGLALEHGDIREALDHANRETAELGVHICRLTAQNEEARERWEALSTRFQEELNTSMTSLQQETLGLQEQLLKEREEKGRLEEEAQGEVRAQKEAQQEEIQALRYQLSNQTINHQTQLQVLSEELKTVRSEVEVEQEKKLYLKTKLKEMESEKQDYHQLLEDNTSWITTSQKLIQQREEAIQHLTHHLTRSEESLVVSQRSCEELREGLRKACQDKQSYELQTSAELDDLYRTKINLEERLIELIREKDALWQKSDALEFEQKLRAEEQTERDTFSNTSQCLSCSSPFSWWLHRHTCRLCGHGFCYLCCSNTVSLMEGGARERCCSVCYNQHSAVVERHPQEETCAAPHTPFNPLPQPGRTMQPSNTDLPRADDGAYDIITEEEVNGDSNSDSLSFTTCSPHTNPQGAAELNGGASTADTTSEDLHDQTGAVQDAEICLLRSGELTLCVPFSVEEISVFGDGLRELFIRSGCYSSIPITGSSLGAIIHWLFTSQPKSISFSVLYREDTHTPLEEAKVLIPLTRCQSHKETMTGELMVRNTGEYTLIFDNSFSRFISKKVLYRLSVEQPVVYDGTH